MGKKFAEMTDTELIELAKDLHQVIYEIECYGTKDLMNFDGALNELKNRGYEVVTNGLSIVKRDVDEEEA